MTITESRGSSMSTPSSRCVCVVCGKPDDGVGVEFPGLRRRAAWLCKEHRPLAGKLSTMSKADLDSMEEKALTAAGNAGGRYLDQIGQTDLDHITKPQYRRYCLIVVMTFGAEMAHLINERPADDRA
jgi:hypothetical protein